MYHDTKNCFKATGIKPKLFNTIELSEDKIITYFESEIGPGDLQSRIQQAFTLQKSVTERTESTHRL